MSDKPPLPIDLKAPVPQTPWRISSALFNRIHSEPTSQTSYKKVLLNVKDPEYAFVHKCFYHLPPKNRSLSRVYVLHNPHLTSAFEASIPSMEEESKLPVFKSRWREEQPSHREQAYLRWKKLTDLFSPFELLHSTGRKETYRQVKVLPLFHGSNAQKCDSIARCGFTYFGKHGQGKNLSTDKGFFGSGIYFTNCSRYAADIYSDGGHLILAWVSMREPYPVVSDVPNGLKCRDMIKLKAQGAFENYNAHYIPVVSLDPEEPKCAIYVPCYLGQASSIDELVVFKKEQTLPRFWIEMSVDLVPMVPIVPVTASSTTGALINLILPLLDNPIVLKNSTLVSLLRQKAQNLFSSSSDIPLDEEDKVFYRQISLLLDESGEIRPSVVMLLTNPPSTPPNFLPSIAFGAEKWKIYFGDPGIEPPLPHNISEILSSPCPLWTGKKVSETHLLVLIPSTVDGRPLTLKSLGELVESPKNGAIARYRYIDLGEYKDVPINRSYWVLMSRSIIPGSRNTDFATQKRMVESLCQKTQIPYCIPGILEATSCILMAHVDTKERLYNDSPFTYTRCNELWNSKNGWPIGVGGFSDVGLSIANRHNDSHDRVGVGVIRRFKS